MSAHLRTNAIVLDMANSLPLIHLRELVRRICAEFTTIQLDEARIRSDEAPDMHVARLCAALSPDALHPVIAYMSAHLTHADLTQVLLNAIPARKLRWYQEPKPLPIHGLRRQPQAGPPMQSLFHDPEVSEHFREDTEALEYLELIHCVVLARDPAQDGETLAFLLSEFAEESTKQEPEVPSYFHPILIIFDQWHKKLHPQHFETTPHADVHMEGLHMERLLNALSSASGKV